MLLHGLYVVVREFLYREDVEWLLGCSNAFNWLDLSIMFHKERLIFLSAGSGLCFSLRSAIIRPSCVSSICSLFIVRWPDRFNPLQHLLFSSFLFPVLLFLWRVFKRLVVKISFTAVNKAKTF